MYLRGNAATRRSTQVQVLHVEDGLIQERGYVLVVQAVVHLSPLPLADHEPHIPQHPELVGDRRL